MIRLILILQMVFSPFAALAKEQDGGVNPGSKPATVTGTINGKTTTWVVENPAEQPGAESQGGNQKPYSDRFYKQYRNMSNDPKERAEARKLIKEIKALKKYYLEVEALPHGQAITRGDRYKIEPIQANHHISARYLNLMLAMGLSEMLTALLTKDPVVISEFWKSLGTFNFHLNYILFESSMSFIAKPTLQFALRNEALFQMLSPHLILPIADFITRYGMDFYSHPKIQQIVAAYDPKSMVIDPDNAAAGPTRDPAVKRKLQNLWRFDVYLDVLKDISQGDLVGNRVFGGLRFGMVNSAFMGARMVLLKPVRGRFAMAVDSVLRPMSNPKIAAAMEKGVFEEASAVVVREIKINNLAKLLRGGRAAGTLARQVFGAGGLAGLGALFVVDGVILAPPTEQLRTTTINMRNVDDEKLKLNRAMEWFNTEKSEQATPWQLVKPNTEKWYWLKFFYDYNGDTESTFFKENQNGWHATTWYGFYEQAAEFVLKYSMSLNLGDYDPQSYSGCKELTDWKQNAKTFLNKLINGRGLISVSQQVCIVEWYKNTIPQFVKSLKELGPMKYVEARVQLLHQAYESYRQNVVLHHVYHHYHLWNLELERVLNEAKAKENYFSWIARGMKESDAQFVNYNQDWHISPENKNLFEQEKGIKISEFITDVLGQPLPNMPLPNYSESLKDLASRCQRIWIHPGSCSVGEIKSLNEQAMIYLQQGVSKLFAEKGEGLTPKDFAQFLAIAVSVRDSSLNEEQKEVAKKLIESPFRANQGEQSSFVEEEEKKKAEEEKVAWMLGGFKRDENFEKNTGGWHDSSQESIEQAAKGIIIEKIVVPYLNTEDLSAVYNNNNPEKTQAIRTYILGLANEVYMFVQGNTNISPETRKLFTLVTATARALAVLRMNLRHEIEEMNKNYKGVVDRAARTKGTVLGSYVNKMLEHLPFGYVDKVDSVTSKSPQSGFGLLRSYINNFTFGFSNNVSLNKEKSGTVFDWSGINNGYFPYYPRFSVTGIFKKFPTVWSIFPTFEGELIDTNARVEEYKPLPYSLINVFNNELSVYGLRLSEQLSKMKSFDFDRAFLDKNMMYLLSGSINAFQAIDYAAESLYVQKGTSSDITDEFKQSTKIILSLISYFEKKNAALLPKAKSKKTNIKSLPEDVQDRIVLNDYIGQEKQKLLKTIERVWPGIKNEIIDLSQDSGFQMFKSDFTRLNEDVRRNLNITLSTILATNAEAADPSREEELRQSLAPARLGVSLTTAMVFYQPKDTGILKLFADQMIFITNKKTLEARIGCYLLDEKLCAGGRVQTGPGHH